MGITTALLTKKPTKAMVKSIVELYKIFNSGEPYLLATDGSGFERTLRDPKAIIVTAHDGDKLVGANVAVPYSSVFSPYGPFDSWISHHEYPREEFLYSWTLTLPEYRGKGVNSEMMGLFDEAIAKSKFRGRLIENLVSSDTTEYFKKRNFEQLPLPPRKRKWINIGDEVETTKFFNLFVKWKTNNDI